MSTINTLTSGESGASSLADINTNFSNLNTDKQEKAVGAVTGNIVKFGSGNVLQDTGKVVPAGTIVGDSDLQTLTNKTLTSPTLTTPVIANFSNAGHNHTGSTSGGQLTDAALSSAVSVSKGGTGATTLTAHGVVVGNGTSAVNVTGTGTSGQVLTSNGAGADPTFQTVSTTVNPTVNFATTFENVSSRYITGSAGSGVVPSVTSSGLNIDTGTSGTSYSWAKATLNASNLFAAGGIFSVFLQTATSGINPTSADAFFGIGNPAFAAGTGITFTDNHIGFKIVYSGSVGTVYATVANGTTETATSLTTVAALDTVELLLKINNSSSVDFWYRKNGGTQSTVNISTNIPSVTTATNMVWGTTNKASTAQSSFSVFSSSFQR